MARKPSKKALEAALDNKIEKIYGQRCYGMAIPMMKIGEVFRIGREAHEAGKTDEEIGEAIFSFIASQRTRRK